MCRQKVKSRKTSEKIAFCCRLKGQGQKLQDPEPVPELDPLVRGTDLRIRIRTKMSRIYNTAIHRVKQRITAKAVAKARNATV
jgi:hypothetical protein